MQEYEWGKLEAGVAVRNGGASVDKNAKEIVDRAVACIGLNVEDIMYLLRFAPGSAEGAYVLDRAHELGMRACGGRGYVYAQIGVDETACPENCLFCNFAAVNVDSAAYDPRNVEVPLERIVHYAKLFDRAGVDLVSLMATAGLDFDRYLQIVRAVREAVSNRVVVMANAGDLTNEQAKRLARAGAGAAYHAIRLDEGVITAIDPDMRRATICNLHAAGIDLMTGVEPVWEGVDSWLLAERICELPALEPFCMGACALTAVDGLDVDGRKPAPVEFVRYVGALARLACGLEVEVGGIGGVAWVDAGCDPRNRGYGEQDQALLEKVASAKLQLEQRGFACA